LNLPVGLTRPPLGRSGHRISSQRQGCETFAVINDGKSGVLAFAQVGLVEEHVVVPPAIGEAQGVGPSDQRCFVRDGEDHDGRRGLRTLRVREGELDGGVNRLG
jgi:hypothetical protein